MQKLIMCEMGDFLKKEPEITKLLDDGWDIYEGPFSLGALIVLKLVKHESLSYTQFKSDDSIDESTEDDHQW